MEIGVVVHGSGIVDSGWALEIINLLSKLGNVHCRLGGTMGRTAVIDAGLENMIDISLKLLPSESLDLFNRENMDVIFLLNYGNSAETGQTFGFKVFSHYFKKINNENYLSTNHKPLYDSNIPVIQIERPGEEDGSIINWNVYLNKKIRNNQIVTIPATELNDIEESYDLMTLDRLMDQLSRILTINIVDPLYIKEFYFSEEVNSKNQDLFDQFLEGVEDKESYKYRKIRGVKIGDNIFINGHAVGKANSNNLVLISKDKFLFEVIGGSLYDHAIEKLGKIDLDSVVVKTGLLRVSDKIKPRVLSKESEFLNEDLNEEIDLDEVYSLKIGFVDIVAFDIYRFKDCDLVITIGDDTTLVASDILYRLDIPIFGIIEGNLDKVVKKSFINDKSIIIEVPSGFDDIIGEEINKNLFADNVSLTIPLDFEFDDVNESDLSGIDESTLNEFKEKLSGIDEIKLNNLKEIKLNEFKEKLYDEVRNIVPNFVVKN